MSWEQASAWFVGLSYGSVQAAAAVLLQSTVLIGLGLVAGRLLRTRGAALQSAVYRTTLVAVVLCPAASLLWDRAGVEGLAIEREKGDAALFLPRAMDVEDRVSLPLE